MDYSALLQELTARLPELEWKISALEASLSMHSLPRGLFRPHLEVTATTCIEEIKADIRTLAEQKMASSAYYLAQRIQQKINVLVTLCHLQSSKPKNRKKTNFGLSSISTRQQWLQSLEQDINRLTEQQEAMSKALLHMQTRGDSQAILQLKAELGEVEKRLTLAKETFARA